LKIFVYVSCNPGINLIFVYMLKNYFYSIFLVCFISKYIIPLRCITRMMRGRDNCGRDGKIVGGRKNCGEDCGKTGERERGRDARSGERDGGRGDGRDGGLERKRKGGKGNGSL
jgi:hypothetical protein